MPQTKKQKYFGNNQANTQESENHKFFSPPPIEKNYFQTNNLNNHTEYK
jgi:hypothetical protein